MKKYDLRGTYKAKGISPDGEMIYFDAQVPGCVHTDLIRCGVFDDLFFSMNARQAQWIENWDFEFEREFVCNEISGDEYLEFDGLDVFCDIYLNDIKIGSADDMFIRYRFKTQEAILEGVNKLMVHFYSPIRMVADKPARPAAFTTERLYIRREQCTFGWDWVQRFVTCGIFRDVKLCVPGKVSIDSVYVRTVAIDGYGAQIDIDIDFEFGAEYSKQEKECFVTFEIYSPNGKSIFSKKRMIVENRIFETVDIDDPQLWWPNGYGQQPFYKLKTVISCKTGVCDEKSVDFGIRTVRILQKKDEPGSAFFNKSLQIKSDKMIAANDFNNEFSGFILLVNETPVMCKGANWVPCEPFASSAEISKYEELIRLAREGNMNMIRVWGGGIFEKECFYDECDRLGIMVTQDFLMACGEYPEDDDWFIDKISKEAEYAVKFLRNHPSLAWWTGDNENGAFGDENNPGFPGRKISLETIFPIIHKYDNSRVYMPSSPYGGFPNLSATQGTTHNTFYITQMADYAKNSDFKDYQHFFCSFLARFVPEAPAFGAPSFVSLKKFMTDEEIFGDNDEAWRYHTKNHPDPKFSEYGLYDMLVSMAEKLFGGFKSKRDRIFKMQLVQYEIVRISMECFRRNKWYSSGLLFWMFNDCWPASGWALVDYYSMPKAGYYGFKRSSKGVIASIDKDGEFYNIYICNDLPRKLSGDMRLYLQDTYDSIVFFEIKSEFAANDNESSIILRVEKEKIDPLLSENTILLCDITGDFGEDRAIFIPSTPKDINYHDANIEVVEKTNESITLCADRFVYAVSLEGDYVFEDNCFPLLPGEEKTINFRPSYISNLGEIEIYQLGGNI